MSRSPRSGGLDWFRLPAALLVGLVNAFGAIYLPQYYNVLPAALMVIAMAINPQGLFTKKEAR